MGKILVLYFAALRDLTSKSEEWLELPGGVDNVGQALEHLEQARPELRGRLGSVRAALNESFAEAHERIADGDTLALIPPVSGG
jgi:molybdopterin synthase sulfur carrier subunit